MVLYVQYNLSIWNDGIRKQGVPDRTHNAHCPTYYTDL
jgi:hypothetical protein